jgi:hypothetical protein
MNLETLASVLQLQDWPLALFLQSRARSTPAGRPLRGRPPPDPRLDFMHNRRDRGPARLYLYVISLVSYCIVCGIYRTEVKDEAGNRETLRLTS